MRRLLVRDFSMGEKMRAAATCGYGQGWPLHVLLRQAPFYKEKHRKFPAV
ncbi:hypothetical protein B4099_1382 [Heyndrickxia coagulans]|uniref:Uncharacterized protein n=1 Tax=Heyndrickxia coagulans TaxID=1398 RepID=A0A150KGJ6_HEYCO|nr:hypothetical protein B4099_1382 [Heyndrickxia coagulans]